MDSVNRPDRQERRVVSSTRNEPTVEQLIADVQKLHRTKPTITRDFYRANGTYIERHWQRQFATFSDFLKAAGITSSLNQPRTDKPQPVAAAPKPPKAAKTPAPKLTPPVEVDEVVGDARTIKLERTRISTLDQLLEHCKVDLAVWEVERFVVNKWEMGTAQETEGQKQIVVEPLFQVKATLRRRSEIVAAKAEIELLKKDAKSFARYPENEFSSVDPELSGNMLEINIPDAHFGKLAWGVETGHENYDTAIAERTFLRALEVLLERSQGYVYDQVLFVVGNDLLNSDDLEGRTTKGTFVSTDGRYQKTFGVVRRTITHAIERLRVVAPVKVVMVSGNHDDLSVWHLGDSLECYFTHYEDVEIDNAPTPRKYHRFGDVLLMFTHGHKGKRSDYPLLMAREQTELFGATKFHEIHTGHTHETKTDEYHGVRVRVLPALCPPDAWHSENGFVGNQRNAEGYIWNAREGLIGQMFYNDNAQEQIAA